VVGTESAEPPARNVSRDQSTKETAQEVVRRSGEQRWTSQETGAKGCASLYDDDVSVNCDELQRPRQTHN
jgi:hypothetical protein